VRGVSYRDGGQDEKITRCTCGAWKYEGTDCATCATLRGVSYELSTNRTTGTTDDVLPRM
jgi:hypothetical protein